MHSEYKIKAALANSQNFRRNVYAPLTLAGSHLESRETDARSCSIVSPTAPSISKCHYKNSLDLLLTKREVFRVHHFFNMETLFICIKNWYALPNARDISLCELIFQFKNSTEILLGRRFYYKRKRHKIYICPWYYMNLESLTFHLIAHFLENSRKTIFSSGCFFLCSWRHVWTKKAYAVIRPLGFESFPLGILSRCRLWALFCWRLFCGSCCIWCWNPKQTVYNAKCVLSRRTLKILPSTPLGNESWQ